MIEIIVREHLNNLLDAPVYLEIPDDAPEKYVTVEKTGSSAENHILSATLAIQSRADSMYEAAALNEKVKAAMKRIVERDEICRSTLNSDYNFTDVTTKKYRYQAVYDLKYYEEQEV